MIIGPVNHNRPIPPETRSEGAKPEAATESVGVAGSDRLELSVSVRERLAVMADAARTESAERSDAVVSDTADEAAARRGRVRLAKARMVSGYYDQPEVKQEIAARLAERLWPPAEAVDEGQA